MIQGTASSVGKSIITAGLCRILKQDGHRVAPFKSQNMALNSYVTAEGGEMGRAQVVQAEACRLEPSVLMNPILLKPTGDKNAQVIINGKVYRNMSAMEYHNFKPEAKNIVREAYEKLASQYDMIVIEGAGSPAEINLRDKDIVNMGMAEIACAPVVLAGDIDRGGVFASIAGTLLLLDEHEKKRVRGIIINKFRGDIEILKPGIKMLEDIIGKPVIGVIPWMDLAIDDEDSVTDKFSTANINGEISVSVIRLPHISNFTDFDIFRLFPDVKLKFVTAAGSLDDADIIIIPGTKNTLDDLSFLRSTGMDREIMKHHEKGKLLAGICGGYQMLGTAVHDPHGVESSRPTVKGLGLLPVETVLMKDKTTVRTSGTVLIDCGYAEGLGGLEVKGYEIHMGETTGVPGGMEFIKSAAGMDGIFLNNIMGTYMHGIFDSHEFSRRLVNNVRKSKGLEPLIETLSYREFRDREYDRLAGILRESVDMKKIYGIINSHDNDRF